MFDTTTGATSRERRSPVAGILSVLLHLLAVGAISGLALLNPTVAAVVAEDVEVTFFSAAPPPPPPPPPPPAGSSKPKTRPKTDTPIPTPRPPDELVQPEEIPEDVPEAPETDPSDQVAVTDGQVGGQVGGQEGGQVGGEVGGKKEGVVGGDITSLSVGDTQGRCTAMAPMPYPEMAKTAGIQGTVTLRLLMDPTGRVAKKKDETCTAFAKASPQDQRLRWHPARCAEAVSGPKEFYYDALTYYGALKCTPYMSGGSAVYYWANLKLDFNLTN